MKDLMEKYYNVIYYCTYKILFYFLYRLINPLYWIIIGKTKCERYKKRNAIIRV